jgi:uncharacterized protein (TIGR02757 family)
MNLSASEKRLKARLDRQLALIRGRAFIASDPVRFLHRYTEQEDREIAAFLAATIAWGRRDLILRSAERMFSLMGKSPAAFVMSGDYRGLGERCVHRTFFEKDLLYFCRGFRAVYRKDGTLEALFTPPGWTPGSIWDGIALFREKMAQANGGVYTKHIADPEAGSACKRINLALRWLVRGGPVDLGLWKNIRPSSLYIPLDLHVGRVARSLGLIERGANDKKTVIELTEKLRRFCPEDPVKYDLALFSMGIES